MSSSKASSAMEQHKISTPGQTSKQAEAAINSTVSEATPPPVGGATSAQYETGPSDSQVTTTITDRPPT
ncbi:unnamed protein product [Didymodactylos carnosus]|uniref:Uncharacterized protein n=1 Tax=Didymodactylos carnosus TaxID=1234261 RepID=A0A816EH14_9BILA|nr:unnamed protein product [Didymodactylos carnosus]CAF1647454.1 unnamed protein product [Didymodactylos carnosus]CAF4451653.1 unnamed protein product [Didymodactylos carnosus]CAF4569468.1 unnamed protein product [Didymodactylos carnosus]